MLLTIAFVILILVGIVAAIYENFTGTTILMIGTGVLYHYTQQNVWHLVRDNYLIILQLVPVYIAIGVGWSFAKWIMFLYGFRDFRNKNIELFKAGKLERYETFYRQTKIDDVPMASLYKPTIIGWMCWWPLSIIATLINDPIRKLFSFLYETFSGSYQRLANKIVPAIDLQPSPESKVKRV